MVAGGDTVLVEARYRGRARATDQDFDIQVAHVLDFRNGKLVRFQQYADTLQFAGVMGVTPGVAAAPA
jgi:ketosteroid isomerase-like protein